MTSSQPSDQAQGRPGSANSKTEPRYLVIGRVVRPWGIRGEVKVEIISDSPERFSLLRRVYLGPQAVPFIVEGVRFQQAAAILKLKGCRDRTGAEKLRGQLVQIPIEEAMPLEEDEYYEHQIIGLDVWTARGEHLGKVEEIIFTGSNDVYVVRGQACPEHSRRGREILIPAIEDVVLEINLAQGRMVVELMEGLV